MTDTTIKKIDSSFSPKGHKGQKYLVSGKSLSMRLWESEKVGEKESTTRDYETVGYVIAGKAELNVAGQIVSLAPGDSWLVPAGATHSYRILQAFTAIEATSPPAEVHGRDD
ncbi:MAG TPA: cupin domain-containing protein [Oculatellaceae cyanobacterium]